MIKLEQFSKFSRKNSLAGGRGFSTQTDRGVSKIFNDRVFWSDSLCTPLGKRFFFFKRDFNPNGFNSDLGMSRILYILNGILEIFHSPEGRTLWGNPLSRLENWDGF